MNQFWYKAMAVLVLSILIIPLLAACGDDDEEQAKTYTLVYSDYAGETSPAGQYMLWFAGEVTKRTKGQVQWQYHWNGSLANQRESLKAVQTGVADMGPWYFGASRDRLPLMGIVGNITIRPDALPGETIGKVAAEAWQKYYKQPEVIREAEANGLKYLLPMPAGDLYLVTRKPVNALADMKGLRISSQGVSGLALSQLGAVVSAIPTDELALAIERGTIDGATMGGGQGTLERYGLIDAARYAYRLSFGVGAAAVVMNLDKWNGLPETVRKTMLDVDKEAPAQYQRLFVDAGKAEAQPRHEAKGFRYLNLPTEAQNRYLEREAAYQDQWVKDQEQNGRPGRRMVDFFNSILPARAD